MFLGILEGTPEHCGQHCHASRDAWLKAGHSVDAADLAVAVTQFDLKNVVARAEKGMRIVLGIRFCQDTWD
ncbi:MAG: hypothetical protein ABJA70_13605 [Chryseolinea sp.]